MADASGTADLITAWVGIATAAGTAIWAVSKYLADRREAREKASEDAERSRRQQHDEEVCARPDRAAALIRAVGEAADPATRRWTAVLDDAARGAFGRIASTAVGGGT